MGGPKNFPVKPLVQPLHKTLTVPLKHIKSADHNNSNQRLGHSFRSRVQKRIIQFLRGVLLEWEKQAF